MEAITKDRQIAAKWAHDLLKGNVCILDSETTGIDALAQICQIAVLGGDGSTLYSNLVKPLIPIPAAASAIHGITDEMVKDAPSMEQVLIPLLKVISNRDVVIYNAEFDLKVIKSSLRPYGIQIAFPTSDRRQCRIWLNGGSIHCAMKMYSQWVGDWSELHNNYRWQKLPGGDHTALGDCRATLFVLRKMAASYDPIEPVQEPASIDF